MRSRGKTVLLVTALVCIVLGAASAGADKDAAMPSPAKVMTRDARVIVGELKEETPESLTLLDIKTGEELTIPQADVLKLDSNVSENEAIGRTGLAAYVAWRVRHAQAATAIGKVVAVEPESVYVSLGGRDGVEVGDVLTARREATPLTDPDTGEVLGKLWEVVAALEVVRVDEKFSEAKPTGERAAELERGNAVELDGAVRTVAIVAITRGMKSDRESARRILKEWTATFVARGIAVVPAEMVQPLVEKLDLPDSVRLEPEAAAQVGKELGAYSVVTAFAEPTGPGRVVVHVQVVKASTGQVLLAARAATRTEAGFPGSARPSDAYAVRTEPGPAAAPVAAQDDSHRRVREALLQQVTLKRPYTEYSKAAHRDKISVQEAVMAVLRQVGLRYNWGESYKNTNPVCRAWIQPSISGVSCAEALHRLLRPVLLTYEIREGRVILRHEREGMARRARSQR